MTSVDNKTIEDFGAQWTAYTENDGYYASVECLKDIIGPLMDSSVIKNKKIADIGSGTGRIVNMLLDCGASQVIGIEPSHAIIILKRNTEKDKDKVKIIHGRGESVGEESELDMIFSIGVIHHIPNPLPVLKESYKALKPGGKIVIWLYGYEGNEVYLFFMLPLCKLTSKMPHGLLSLFSDVSNLILDLYLFLAKFIPLPMKDYMQSHLSKLTRPQRKLTIYDQLNPAYAKYYKKQEAYSLLECSGFTNINLYHRHNYSWTVVGEKPEA